MAGLCSELLIRSSYNIHLSNGYITEKIEYRDQKLRKSLKICVRMFVNPTLVCLFGHNILHFIQAGFEKWIENTSRRFSIGRKMGFWAKMQFYFLYFLRLTINLCSLFKVTHIILSTQ